jgi:multidrug efflux pump
LLVKLKPREARMVS